MNRRYFLPALTAGAFSKRAIAAVSDRVRLAVVGVRGRGRALAEGFAKLPDATIEYLVDPDDRVIPNAAAAVEKAGRPAPKVVRDLRRVLDDKSVDAVVIATPDHWHAPAAILACDAGKDVYLEKPCSHNIREGSLLIDATRRNRRIVQHGTQARSREITREAIEFAQSGSVGKIRMAKAWDVQKREDIGNKPDSPVPPGVDFDLWTGPAELLSFNENRFHYNWHWHWNFGTGDAGNDGAHQIDMARWALGVKYPAEAAGSGSKLFFDDDQQTPDTMNVTFTYPGRMLQFELRIWNPYGMEGAENGVSVYGSEGMVQIAKWNRLWGYKVFDRKGGLVKHEQRDGEDEAHLRNFLDCVKTRKTPNAEIEIGFESVVHCHLANIVSRTGHNIRYDAATHSVGGPPDASKLVSRKYRHHWAKPRNV